MKSKIRQFLFLLFFFSSPVVLEAETYNVDVYPISYILEKAKSYDIVFLGARHKKQAVLRILSDLIPHLHKAGVTHLGLEISSDQQSNIDAYLQNGTNSSDIELHHQIDCPEYRKIFELISALDKEKRPGITAIDLPKSMYAGKTTRDEWMAGTIARSFRLKQNAKMLVVVGNLHILKKIEWEEKVSDNHGFIRSYLEKLMPGRSMFSIGQCIDELPDECDFTREFASMRGAIALDCDMGFTGWKIGIIAPVAAKPSEVCELLDGLIVH